MATRREIQDSLNVFSETIITKEIDEALINTFFQLFRDVPSKPYREACFKCLDELQFFPKPKDIRDRLPKRDTHTAEERKRFTCPICENYVDYIIEGKCIECHRGVPVGAGRKPVVQSIDPFEEKKNFTIQQNMMCNQCHKKNVMCIKEPADTGIWQCRECYTGLTADQIKGKFEGLAEIMEGD
jgi:ribosomal protein L37AE/L43A